MATKTARESTRQSAGNGGGFAARIDALEEEIGVLRAQMACAASRHGHSFKIADPEDPLDRRSIRCTFCGFELTALQL